VKSLVGISQQTVMLKTSNALKMKNSVKIMKADGMYLTLNDAESVCVLAVCFANYT
jgi:hypothetical protein